MNGFTQRRFVLIAAQHFFRPCVYGVKRYGHWVYIGSSQHGLARLAGHHAIAPATWRKGDELFIWYHESDDMGAIRKRERELIFEHKPLRNKEPHGRAKAWSKPKTKARQSAWRRAKYRAMDREAALGVENASTGILDGSTGILSYVRDGLNASITSIASNS